MRRRRRRCQHLYLCCRDICAALWLPLWADRYYIVEDRRRNSFAALLPPAESEQAFRLREAIKSAEDSFFINFYPFAPLFLTQIRDQSAASLRRLKGRSKSKRTRSRAQCVRLNCTRANAATQMQCANLTLLRCATSGRSPTRSRGAAPTSQRVARTITYAFCRKERSKMQRERRTYCNHCRNKFQLPTQSHAI